MNKIVLCMCFAAGVAMTACGEVTPAVVDAAPVSDTAPPGPDALAATCTPVAGTEVTIDPVATGLVRPVFLTSPPDDPRLFILEQPGRIRIVKDGELLEKPFLDIEDLALSTGNEQGLLGLAFHPEYAQNGRFFVNYTAKDPVRATVVARYQVSADPDVAGTAETRLLTIDQPYNNHNGGMIAFGPDGYLYIGMGDGGSADDPLEAGEDVTTLLGAMLRIDINGAETYAIPASNPYADSPNGLDDPRPEIWAIGLRNPWRFSFDRDTGDLYIADVGQRAWEEVNVQPAGSAGGENYGWDIMEGSHCHEPLDDCDMTGKVLPVAEYDHSGDLCSITGGYVYRGACMPDLQGTYFYADYCTSQVWTFRYDNGVAVDQQELATDLGGAITSFGQDALGELYSMNGDTGVVYRIVPAGN